MTDVRAPDGSIARFPDDMPDHEIEAVMRREYGGGDETVQTAASEPARKGSTGLFLSEDERGNIGPGMLLKPFAAGMELMRHGYQPQATQPVSSEDAMPDEQAIKLAAQAAPAAMPATRFPGAAAAPRAAPAPAPVATQATRNEVIAAGQRQGVDVPGFMASESLLTKRVAGGLKDTPLIGDPIVEATHGMSTKMGQRVAELSGNATREASVPGAGAKAGIVDWTTRGFRGEMDQAYRPLDVIIRPETMVPLSKTRAAARDLGALDRESASSDGQKVIALVDAALSRDEGLSWQGLKELRTRVGERVHGDIAPEAGVSARALNKLYAALTEDVKFGVGLAGKGVKGGGVERATAAFEAANTKAQELFDLRKRLTEIVGAKGENAAESVFHRIVAMASSSAREDTQQLLRAKSAAGASWQSVVDSAVARLGHNAKTGEFSPEVFLTDYSKKLSESGRSILFGPGLRSSLDDIATLSREWAKNARFGNPSGSGRSVAISGALVGAYASPLTTIAGVVTGVVLARMLAQPAAARAVRDYSRAAVSFQQSPTPAKRQLLEAASRNIMNIAQSMGGGQPQSEGDTKLVEPAPSGGWMAAHAADAPRQVGRIEDALRLPKGSQFLDPHGVVRVR